MNSAEPPGYLEPLVFELLLEVEIKRILPFRAKVILKVVLEVGLPGQMPVYRADHAYCHFCTYRAPLGATTRALPGAILDAQNRRRIMLLTCGSNFPMHPAKIVLVTPLRPLPAPGWPILLTNHHADFAAIADLQNVAGTWPIGKPLGT